MRFHNIVHDDLLNGDGLRSVVFVSGCEHKCPGCQNPVTWDPRHGLLFDEAAKEELFESLRKDYVSGVTFSGGDPFALFNRDEVLSLIKEIREAFPSKTVWVYTGYTKEELEEQGFWEKAAEFVDVLVEGRFVLAEANVGYPWAGSTNQRVLRKESGFRINTSAPEHESFEVLLKEFPDRADELLDAEELFQNGKPEAVVKMLGDFKGRSKNRDIEKAVEIVLQGADRAAESFVGEECRECLM